MFKNLSFNTVASTPQTYNLNSAINPISTIKQNYEINIDGMLFAANTVYRIDTDIFTHTENAITTNVIYSPLNNGLIKGRIAIVQEDVPYKGTIQVFESNTNKLVSEFISTDGQFSLNGFNPILKYDVKCIPESDIYYSKVIEDYQPELNLDLPIIITELSETSTLYYKYDAVFKLNNVGSNPTVTISDAPFLSVSKLKDGIYLVSGVPPSNTFSYQINVSDNPGTITKTASMPVSVNMRYGLAQVDFYNQQSIYPSSLLTLNGTANLVQSGGSNYLKTIGTDNTVSLSDPNNSGIFNIASTDSFELVLTFAISSKIGNDKICVFSSNSGDNISNTGHVAFEINKNGFSFRKYNSTTINNTSFITQNYVFESNKEYTLRIVRSGNIKIFINSDLVLTTFIYSAESFNFALNGFMNFGFARWYNSNIGASLLLKSFNLSKNANGIRQYELYSEMALPNTVYSLIFRDNVIYDSFSNSYIQSRFTKGSSFFFKNNTGCS